MRACVHACMRAGLPLGLGLGLGLELGIGNWVGVGVWAGVAEVGWRWGKGGVRVEGGLVVGAY